ncbi:hypothetical protein AGMMS50284_2720 [Clostridia bacterium]|nr:hypothetical protein AGMMS50284_2720 [Clostridia bacterium]
MFEDYGVFITCKSDHKLRDFCGRQGKNGARLWRLSSIFDAVLAQKDPILGDLTICEHAIV